MEINNHPVVISNSSPIINLSKINYLPLLQKLFQRLIIPAGVYEELVVKGKNKEFITEILDLIKDKIIKIEDVKDILLAKALNKDLDKGESEVIVLALEKKADLILVDEIEAREIASIYNLNKTGFIGLLIRAKRLGLIDAVKKPLDEAIEKGFWINMSLYKKILQNLLE